jgi:hypothetical protein
MILTLIVIGVSCCIAFFIGSHVYEKYGAMLSMWKHTILPVSILVEPYIYAYRFRESVKHVYSRYLTKVVISFIVSYLLFSPLIGLAFTAGYIFEYFSMRKMLKPSADNTLLVAKLFADFVRPGMEDELAGEITTYFFKKMTGITFRR